MRDIDANLELVFTGDISPEDIDVSELISILRAHQTLVRKSINFLYGGNSKTKIGITNVSPGSIDIGSVVQIIGSLQPAFAMLPSISLGISSPIELIKNWLEILKFLGQKPPKSIQKSTTGQNVIVENAIGDTMIVNGNVINTFIIGDIGRPANAFQAPLRAGATGLKLKSNGKVFAEYSKRDIEQFVPIQPESEILSHTIEIVISVISPVFEGEGIWRFKYGGTSISAKILDTDFLEKVYDGSESFRRGDSFRVLMNTQQKQVGAKIITTHKIERFIGRL
jgi:hypothetical protein